MRFEALRLVRRITSISQFRPQLFWLVLRPSWQRKPPSRERARELCSKHFRFRKCWPTALASLHPIELDSNEVLINQGDASDAAYYLDRGSLLVYAETSYGPVSLAT